MHNAKEAPPLSKEDKERFQELFRKLDVNKDGRIEIHELTQGLKTMKVPEDDAQGHAEVFFRILFLSLVKMPSVFQFLQKNK